MANSRYYHCWTLTPSSSCSAFHLNAIFLSRLLNLPPFSLFYHHHHSHYIPKHFSFNTTSSHTSFFPSIFILLFSYIFILFSYCVQQTVKAKEHKTSCERYIELKMENNKFIVKHERMREWERQAVVFLSTIFRKGRIHINSRFYLFFSLSRKRI